MNLDIVELRDFYASELGQLARRLLVRRLRALWPDVTGQTVVGLGYAAPFLGVFREEAERSLAFMPARQGVARWPSDGPNSCALVEQADLPLGDGTVDRLIVAHCLEAADNTEALLHEMWRVLAPGGRVIVLVPNRRGLWARFEHTPFGHGRPYSRSQLSRLLRDANFATHACEEALWMPPFRSRLLMRSAGAFERAGSFVKAMPPGALALEATKKVHGAIPAKAEKRRRLRILVPDAMPVPARRVAKQ